MLPGYRVENWLLGNIQLGSETQGQSEEGTSCIHLLILSGLHQSTVYTESLHTILKAHLYPPSYCESQFLPLASSKG
jgi:hypothetical protein